MKIYVDADACPVKEQIVKVAKKLKIPVIMVMDTSHLYEDGYSKVITVDRGKDSADITIANLITKDDVVVTSDYGVATMALTGKAKAIDQNGRIYNDKNIDRLLFTRHLSMKLQRAGKRRPGPKKRTKQNDIDFENKFFKLCKSVK